MQGLDDFGAPEVGCYAGKIRRPIHAAAWVTVHKAYIIHVVTLVAIPVVLRSRSEDVLQHVFTLLQRDMVGCTLFVEGFDTNGLLRFKLFRGVRASLDEACFVGVLQVC